MYLRGGGAMLFIRPSSDGTYNGMVMSVRLSVRVSVRPTLRPSVRPSGSPSASFPHFSPTCFDILSWNFAYDFVLLYYRSSSSIFNLRHVFFRVMPLLDLRILEIEFSSLFSYMLWYIELKFSIWLCFTVLQIKFECRQFALIFVGVMPLL